MELREGEPRADISTLNSDEELLELRSDVPGIMKLVRAGRPLGKS